MKILFSKKKLLLIFFFGILIRLITAFLFTHNFDFFIFLVLSKSIADVGNLYPGFFVILEKIGEIQIHSKIFYQITALWLKFLDYVKIINLNYLFDAKPYQNISNYLEGFLIWGPFHYQIFSIKLIQFIYDFLILFILLKIIKEINLSNEKNNKIVFLFWAFNPFIIITGYILFQSDLLLLIFLLASLYFLLRFNKNNKFLDFLLFIITIAFGASIKQLPLLLIPVFIILYCRNLLEILTTITIFLCSYLLSSQSFSVDFPLIKNFFINSKESLQLFEFKLNNIPIFFIAYFSILYYFYFKKEIIKKRNDLLIVGYLLIIIIVYLTYNNNYLFIQFNLWIIPFILLASLIKKEFSFMMLAPSIGLVKRLIEDSNSMIGALTSTLGSPFQYYLSYNYFINKFINPQVLYYFISSLLVFSYIISFVFLIKYFMNKKIKNFINLSVEKTILIIFGFFLVFYISDFLIRKNTLLLTRYTLKNERDSILNKELTFTINNPNKFKITGFDIKIKNKQINDLKPLELKILDEFSKEIIKIRLETYLFLAEDKEILTILLPKPIANKKITVKILNQSNNQYLISTGELIIKSDERNAFAGYDYFYNKNKIQINFVDLPFYINLRGEYSFKEIYNNLVIIFNQKPKFYKLCFVVILLILISNLLLIVKEILKIKFKFQ